MGNFKTAQSNSILSEITLYDSYKNNTSLVWDLHISNHKYKFDHCVRVMKSISKRRTYNIFLMPKKLNRNTYNRNTYIHTEDFLIIETEDFEVFWKYVIKLCRI